MKPRDLGIGPRPPHDGQTIPSFNRQNRVVSSNTQAGAGSFTIFNPHGACTVQWIIAVTSAACTLQLLLNGQPYGAPLPLNAGAVVRFAGTFLANNELLGFSVSAATTVNFEVAWVKDFHRDILVTETAIISSGTVAGISSVNLVQQNGVALSIPTADAPVGTETAPVVRDIFRKKQNLLTTTPLAANGVFTSPWFDTELTGTNYVIVTAVSNVPSTSSALFESEDQVNSRGASSSSGPSATTRYAGFIRSRYWRVVYTNGASAQATFSLYATESSLPITNDAFNALTGEKVNVAIGSNLSTLLDGFSNNAVFAQTAGGGTGGLFAVLTTLYNGTSWDKTRTPSIFKQVSTAATGSTALWTPTAGKKFRLMRYRVIVTALAKAAVAADLVIDLLDAAATLGLKTLCTIPAAAAGNGLISDSGWIDLGNGILSAAANNVLNLNLSFALTGGLVNVNACGTEE